MHFQACAVIPVYNHHRRLGAVVNALRSEGLACILVDDGSDAETKGVLADLARNDAQLELLTLPVNRGKGAAVLAGLERALQRGYSHALQVDADGQHEIDDAAAMLKLAGEHQEALISGLPQYDASVPKARYYGRYLTHVWVWIETLSLQLKDSMCGFRVYPLAPTLKVAARVRLGARMDFDTEVMVRLYWAGVDSLFLPTRVRYPEDGVSHFRPVIDNVRISWMHTRLACGMLWRAPLLIARHWERRETHWTEIDERGSVWAMRLLALLCQLLGRRAGHQLLRPVVAYYFLTHGIARRASQRFLALVEPRAQGGAMQDARPTALGTYRQMLGYARANLDKVIAWTDLKAVPVRLPTDQTLHAELTSGRGALLLTAHMGSTELARAYTDSIPGLKVNALVYTRHLAKYNGVLACTSKNYGLRLIQVQEINPGTGVLLREKVAAGELLVMVGDRTPVGAMSPTVAVQFLGHPAPLAVGPYVLAHLLECPVYLFFCLAEGDGYRIHLERFAERIRLPRGSRETALRDWAQRYATRLEDYAIRFPLQWYNFFDFWAERAVPAEAASRQRSDGHGQHSKTTA